MIGIDSTVPTAQFEKEAAANGGGINITGILSTIGFVRTVVWVVPSGGPEKRRLHPIRRSRAHAPNDKLELRQRGSRRRSRSHGQQHAALREVTYPENLPVLHFLASDNVALTPDWLDSHRTSSRTSAATKSSSSRVSIVALVTIKGHGRQDHAIPTESVPSLSAPSTGCASSTRLRWREPQRSVNGQWLGPIGGES